MTNSVDILGRSSGLMIDGAQDKLCNLKISVVGAGAIGSWLMIALAKMGCTEVTFYDDDTIEAANYNNQIYGVSDIGSHKLDALKLYGEMQMPITGRYQYKKQFYTPDDAQNPCDVLIMGVDNIAARKMIFDANRFNKDLKLILDGRIGRQVYTNVAIDPTSELEMDYYEQNLLFEKGAEIPCTEKTYISSCLAVASNMASALRNYVNNNLAKVPYMIYHDGNIYNTIVTKRNPELLIKGLT